jgi:hypothetical protein
MGIMKIAIKLRRIIVAAGSTLTVLGAIYLHALGHYHGAFRVLFCGILFSLIAIGSGAFLAWMAKPKS